MQTDTNRIEFTLKQIEELWSKIRPGRRLTGMDREGNNIVIPVENPMNVIGSFESEAEATAYSRAPEHINQLTDIIRTLLSERQEALKGYQEICEKVDPAHEDFVSQRPVDMKEVLQTTKHWCHYILENQSNGQH